MKNNIVNWKYERDRGFIFYLIGFGCQKVHFKIKVGKVHKKSAMLFLRSRMRFSYVPYHEQRFRDMDVSKSPNCVRMTHRGRSRDTIDICRNI